VSGRPDLAALLADPARAIEVPAEKRQAVLDALAVHDVHHDDQVGHPAAHGNDTWDQPEPGRDISVWHTCISRPLATLAAVVAGLTPPERPQLHDDADPGNRLAQTVLSDLGKAGG
jgi:hypothetical protein